MRASRFSGIFLSGAKPDGETPASDRSAAAPSEQNTSVPWLSSGVQSVLHYEIQTKLGEGGMGVVYKALDKKLNRAVALKFLPPRIDRSKDDLQRFLQEAQALSALNHPHIATIYAVETAGDKQFLVLEYLPGGTLRAKLHQASGSLTIEDIFKYAQQTAEGLAHAHSRGIVHRDVKTSNLMLTADGNVKITDFGLAKLSAPSLATIPGSLMGTIAYMSPEQAMGMEVDARSDVFSFGVCLFELITGRLPFEAPNEAALITKVASARAPELKDSRSDIPAGLDLVVQRAMRKRVEDRYQTMDDVLQALQVPARPNLDITQTRIRPSVGAQVAGTPKRARWIAAVSLVVLLAGLLVFMRQRQHEREEQQRQQQQSPQPPKQLVVLRLRNVSKDPSLQPLCDGLTELLTNKLIQVAQLEGQVAVVPASEVIKENKEGKQEVTSAKEALRVFGAALVVEGSFQRMGGQVKVGYSLIDTAKQTSVAAGDVTVPEESLSELNDLFLSRASEMLKVRLNAEQRRALPVELPKNTGAYELYVEGRYLQRYDRLDTLDNAIDFFQKALAKDSTYALGYARLAEAYLRKYNATKADELISQARYNAQRAIELNASLAPVHYAMGLIHAANGDYELAIDSFDRSIKIQPESDAYREKANAYYRLNRPTDAEATYRNAIQIRPKYWAGYREFAVFLQNQGRLDEALPQFEKVVELTPDNYAGWSNLGGLYLRMKEREKAIECFERANAITPRPAAYNNLGTAFFELKRDEDAVEMYKKAIQLLPTYAAAWGGLGDAYRRMPKSKKAMRDAYAHAIELTEKELLVNPRDGRTWTKIAMWRVATDKKKALKEIREALRLSSDDSFVQARAASVYAQSGMDNKALTALERAIELGYPLAELESWPPLEQLMHGSGYKAFMEERARKSSPVQPSNK